MAKVEFPLKYHGWTSKSPKWKLFTDVLYEIWGREADTLPTYPKVIGGIHGYWINRSGIKFTAESVDEIHKEFQKGTVTEIYVLGSLNGTNAFIAFKPDEKYMSVEVTSDKFEVSDAIISLVKKYFPKTNGARDIGKSTNNISVREDKERWYQKWWGQIIVSVIGGLILAVIIWIIPWF